MHARTRVRPVNGPFSRIIQVSWYQKGKTNLDFTEARDSKWQWHQLGRMQVCTSLQTNNHASTPSLSFFTGRMPFLPPNQQRQSTEGIHLTSAKHSYRKVNLKDDGKLVTECLSMDKDACTHAGADH